ncbi:MAG: enoyl-CoA hydratase-related protein [Hyphomicrobiaceae bacterium]
MNEITLGRESSIAVVSCDRPGKRNAMTLAMWRAVGETFVALGREHDVRGIILTGAGGSFSVGADVSEFEAARASAAAAKDYELAVDACADAIAAVSKPTVAAINGYCLGGGCHLALACDFRIAAPGASIGIPAAKLSIVYGVRSTQRLLSLVGLAAAKRILYSGRRYGAADAFAMGLVEEVTADPVEAARTLLNEIIQNAPLSIGGAKAILTGLSMGSGVLDLQHADKLIDQAADSADYREGRLAFAEKRAPRFKGS